MKNAVILGDSYSTFADCIPEGYKAWYDSTTSLPESDVSAKEQTWWYQFREKTGCNLVRNDSWSGSTIGNTGYDGADFSAFSYVTRLDRLIEQDFFVKNDIDTLIVFGGTNDAWSDAPLGELDFDAAGEALYSSLPAIGYLTRRIDACVPASVRVLIVINSDIKPAIQNALADAAEHFGFEHLRLHDIDKMSGHPCQSGMRAICDQVAAYLTEHAPRNR